MEGYDSKYDFKFSIREFFDAIWLDVDINVLNIRELRYLLFLIKKKDANVLVKWGYLLKWAYEKAIKDISAVLLEWIFTNPHYDRRFQRLLRRLDYVLLTTRSISHFFTYYTDREGYRLIANPLHALSEKIQSELKRAKKELEAWFDITQDASYGVLTKGERKVLNQMFLEELKLKREIQIHYHIDYGSSAIGISFLNEPSEKRLKELIESYRERQKIPHEHLIKQLFK